MPAEGEHHKIDLIRATVKTADITEVGKSGWVAMSRHSPGQGFFYSKYYHGSCFRVLDPALNWLNLHGEETVVLEPGDSNSILIYLKT